MERVWFNKDVERLSGGTEPYKQSTQTKTWVRNEKLGFQNEKWRDQSYYPRAMESVWGGVREMEAQKHKNNLHKQNKPKNELEAKKN